jgi:hypothetical protein
VLLLRTIGEWRRLRTVPRFERCYSILPGNAMSQLREIDLFSLASVDGIATIFMVLFVALVLLIGRWLWR